MSEVSPSGSSMSEVSPSASSMSEHKRDKEPQP
ncbi:hypothetical protein M2162_006831 [Streptomyces sp. SAI-041]|nr:hypothetical protein [Streptomyces sp. SAI-041]